MLKTYDTYSEHDTISEACEFKVESGLLQNSSDGKLQPLV